jgi:hypothetical protein
MAKTTVMMVRRMNGLVPATVQDQELIEKYQQGEGVRVEISGVRNMAHHRKLFALLNIVLQNTDKYSTMDHLLTEVKILAGHYDEHISANGELRYIPKSIAVASMAKADFEVFYSRVMDIVLQHFMVGSSEYELENEVRQYLAFM